uniref:BTB/POZ domain-containing protein At1g21780-like n=1 Tax=Rhizophora mucronata TaxID=61149 RepID=A0A2P2K3W8_RHIMU
MVTLNFSLSSLPVPDADPERIGPLIGAGPKILDPPLRES